MAGLHATLGIERGERVRGCRRFGLTWVLYPAGSYVKQERFHLSPRALSVAPLYAILKDASVCFVQELDPTRGLWSATWKSGGRPPSEFDA
ncbi:MAG: hypothetical protein ACRDU4_01040 [Mycobacterium sp.]